MEVTPLMAAFVPSFVLAVRQWRLTTRFFALTTRPIELVGYRAITEASARMMRGVGIWQWSIALGLLVSGGPWWSVAMVGTALAVFPRFWAPSLRERQEPWEPIVDLRNRDSIEAFLAEDS